MTTREIFAQLRQIAIAPVQPPSPLQEFAAGLPPYANGQRFTAKLEAELGDGTFRALINGSHLDGKHLTLSLSQAARAGDTLDLIVTSRTPNTIVAALAPSLASPIAPAAQGSIASLSRPAQLLGDLLAPDQGAPQPVLLARGEPLLSVPGKTGFDALPQLLQQAIAESGLFYESHQARWLDGQLPREALLREPQGQYSGRPPPAPAAVTQNTFILATSAASLDAHFSSAATTFAPAPGPVLTSIPADLVPLVRQQLDALTGNHLQWQGQIWPGQMLQWQIYQPHDETADQNAYPSATAATDEMPQWRTTLRLTLPLLGALDATLSLSAGGVHVAIAAESMSVDDLRGGQHDLTQALASAGVPLLGLKFEPHESA